MGHGTISDYMLTFLKEKILVILQTMFYRNRLDASGEMYRPAGLNLLTSRFNQYLIEKGYSPAWIWSEDDCRRFWSTEVNQYDNANEPQQYSSKSTELIEFMAKFWEPHVQSEYKVLELGCNAGANLDTLRLLGFTRLEGVEINPEAVKLMSSVFPDLYRHTNINVGSLEDKLPLLATDSSDVIFTMAVLMHVHPKSKRIFSEMVRVARRFIVTVEPEFANYGYVFARNYRRVFQSLGCKQLTSVTLGVDTTDDAIADYHGIILRLFSVPNVDNDLT
ncbi:MAG: hypothetical protein CL606_02575 [Anaerolineaceae bacterium]|nr:hypothetical protein [Anaerolineaceae bacterium]|tara:strand:+ start:474 stop:1304 length:831 start_codon:yes stop_codon:yes gene_type:complete